MKSNDKKSNLNIIIIYRLLNYVFFYEFYKL